MFDTMGDEIWQQSYDSEGSVDEIRKWPTRHTAACLLFRGQLMYHEQTTT